MQRENRGTKTGGAAGEGNFTQTPVGAGVTLKETSGVLLVTLVWVYLSGGGGEHWILFLKPNFKVSTVKSTLVDSLFNTDS